MATSKQQPDDAPAGPVELLPVAQAGATFAGAPVRRLKIELSDGREQKLEPPEPEEPGAEEPRFSPRELAVIALFARHDPEARLKGQVIARLTRIPLGSLKHPLARLTKLDILDAAEREAGYVRGPNFDENLAADLL